MRHTVLFFLIMLILASGSGCNLEDLVNDAVGPDPPNVGNIVSDAADFKVYPLDTARFWINASDPQGEQLQYQWRINAGEIIGPGGRDSLIWRAPIAGGNYILSVEVSNSAEKVTRSETIKVVSVSEPKVGILQPEHNAFLVQHTSLTVKASALHENGIQAVEFWLDDTRIPISPVQTQDTYAFEWQIDTAPGQHELKVRAIAQLTGTAGSDSIMVFVEGMIAGKK
jgi:hypothetical protein